MALVFFAGFRLVEGGAEARWDGGRAGRDERRGKV